MNFLAKINSTHMHSQVALLLQDAFLQAENFSIPGIGSFSQEQRPDSPLVDIVFDTDESKAPSLANIWVRDTGISPAQAAQKLSELRVAIRWALKTNGHFMIPEVGTLHQHEPGKLQFHTLAGPKAEKPPVIPTPAPEQEPELVTSPSASVSTATSRSFNNRTISYVLIGTFALIGLLIVGQAIWGGNEENDSSDTNKQAQQASLQDTSEEEAQAQLAHTASYSHPETQVDSPLKPVSKDQIVSTSRPQDRALVSPKTETSPASRISTREASEQLPPAVSSSTPSEEAVADISVLDTIHTSAGTNPSLARMASRGQSSPPPTTEARNQYHLIAGSFANYQAAQAFTAEMRQQGSEAIILPASAETHMQYRVSIFHHPSREAVASHKQMLIKAGKKAGWIFAPAASSF